MPGCGSSPGTKLSSRSEFNAAKAPRASKHVETPAGHTRLSHLNLSKIDRQSRSPRTNQSLEPANLEDLSKPAYQ